MTFEVRSMQWLFQSVTKTTKVKKQSNSYMHDICMILLNVRICTKIHGSILNNYRKKEEKYFFFFLPIFDKEQRNRRNKGMNLIFRPTIQPILHNRSHFEDSNLNCPEKTKKKLSYKFSSSENKKKKKKKKKKKWNIKWCIRACIPMLYSKIQ